MNKIKILRYVLLLSIVLCLVSYNVLAYRDKFSSVKSKFYPEIGSYYIDKQGRAVIRVGEIIRYDTYNRIRNKINELVEAGTKTIILDFNSPGGDQETTNVLSIYLNLIQQRGTTVITYVGTGHQCNSGCTVLFATGSKRIASNNALFGFHYGSSGTPIFEGLAGFELNELQKYYANVSVYQPIFKLCSSNNTLSKAIMDPTNKLYVFKGTGLKRACSNYVTDFLND